ncbi:MAG: hypothetical protein WC595_06430 [Candidatus Nanoarchaeia archaeon]
MKTFTFAFVLLTLIFITACETEPPPPVNQPSEITTEINRLKAVAEDRNLTVEDYSQLNQLTQPIPYYQDGLKKIEWLTEHGEADHAAHGLSYLLLYSQTGKEYACLIHDLSHIESYLHYNDLAMAEEAIKELDAQPWIDKAEKSRQRLPQYYKNFDQLKATVLDTVERLKNKNYSQTTLDQIEYLDKTAPC